MSSLKVTAVQCPSCGDVIFSRSHHDFRGCSCRRTFIDGGREYTKVGFRKSMPVTISLELLNSDENRIFQDWDRNINKYGLIKTELLVNSSLLYTFDTKNNVFKVKTNEC